MNRRLGGCLIGCAIAWASMLGLAVGQETESSGARLNLPVKTLGGKQFWTDHRWWNGWRLQQNLFTGHWRLLDPRDIRRAWGGRDACLAKLVERQEAEAPVAPAESVVVLLHGLMRSGDSMAPVAEAFTARGDAQPIIFTYASTQASIDDHAAALREWVEHLPGRPKLSFVGHSLGNIVLRRAIAMWQRDSDPTEVLPRLHRVVMLGPPNQGSSIAKRLSSLGLFERLTGTSGQELGAAWDDLQSRLATPPCPFCIVAGDLSESSIKNPLVAGKSDFVVTLEETRLEGAAENVTLPVLHSFLMSDSGVLAATLRFIEPVSSPSVK